MLVLKNGKFHFIKQSVNETVSQHIARGWFIVNNLDQEYPRSIVEQTSNMWAASEYYHCEYSPELTKRILELKSRCKL